MKLLLTNDDGITAAGIRALRQACLAAGHRVWVVAPDRERSGSGHAITLASPLYVTEVPLGDDGPAGYAVSGTPADCAKLALRAICDEPPDMVLSGINRGPNLGTDVFYSGTVSAALEAVILGVPAIALSLDGYTDLDYGYAADYAVKLAAMAAERGMPEHALLNVNFPAIARERIAGTAVTRLGDRRYRNVFERRVDEGERAYYCLLEESLDNHDEPATDVWAVGRNLVSLTPVHVDLTNHGLIQTLAPWASELSR